MRPCQPSSCWRGRSSFCSSCSRSTLHLLSLVCRQLQVVCIHRQQLQGCCVCMLLCRPQPQEGRTGAGCSSNLLLPACASSRSLHPF